MLAEAFYHAAQRLGDSRRLGEINRRHAEGAEENLDLRRSCPGQSPLPLCVLYVSAVSHPDRRYVSLVGIVGTHPETGMRLVLERAGEGPPWVYAGTAFTPATRHDLRVRVDATAAVEIEAPEGTPAEILQRAKAMVRIACKHAIEEDPPAPPPRHIHRWRGA